MSQDRPELLLDNQLCFLFHRITRDLTAAYRPLLTDLGLTYPQYLVMLVLWEQDGRTVGDLGRDLCLDSGTLSPLIRRLVSAGLVDKTRNPRDERQVTVHLTPGRPRTARAGASRPGAGRRAARGQSRRVLRLARPAHPNRRAPRSLMSD